MSQSKRILLLDFDDSRRETRLRLLSSAGYEVAVRDNYVVSEELDREGTFDIVILALHRQDLEEAAAYSDRLAKQKPGLPILLLTDLGVFTPRGTLSQSIETGDPAELMKTVASMLAGSTHIREVPESFDD